MPAGILSLISDYGGIITEIANRKEIRVEKVEGIFSRSERRIKVASDPFVCLV